MEKTCFETASLIIFYIIKSYDINALIFSASL